MEAFKHRFIELIKEIRFISKVESVTDQDFYKNLIGVSYEGFSSWRTGRNPTLKHVIKLIENSPKPINTDYLFYGAGEPFKASQDAIPTKAQIVYTPTPLETAIEQIATNQTKLIELMDKLSV